MPEAKKKKFAFLVTRPPFKSENPKLACTHSLAGFVAAMRAELDEIIISVSFADDGVLNCIKNQKSQDFYNLGSNEKHIKNMLASDIKILVCKEDLDKFGINQERLVDAKDIGSDATINVVPFSEIQKELEDSDSVMFF